jgi:Mn2+/Fe2+ NRAMP family transporter
MIPEPTDPLINEIEVKTKETSNPLPKKSKWTLIGSAIIISIACIDPGNLQGI